MSVEDLESPWFLRLPLVNLRERQKEGCVTVTFIYERNLASQSLRFYDDDRKEVSQSLPSLP